MNTAVLPPRSFVVPSIAAPVFMLALAFYLGFTDYGFNREDEGALLVQFWRWSGGEVPYRDFHMGYTPGVYFVHKTLMQWFGPGLLPGRYLLALVNSSFTAILFVLTARITASWKWGLLSPLLFLAATPVYPGDFAVFNIPYPAWYNLLLFALTAAMMPRLAGRPTLLWLLGCGLLAGLGFSFKPNVGLFQLAASALVCLLGYGRPRSRAEHLLWWAWWLAILAGLLAVFSSAQSTRDLVMFLAPVVAVAIAVARDAYRKPVAADEASLLACASALGVGFLVVCIPWMVWSYSILGPEWFARRALFIGAGFESVYYLSSPPTHIGGIVVLTAAAVWFLPRWLDRRGWPSWHLPIAGAAFAVAAFVYLAMTRPMPGGISVAVMKAVEPRIFAAAVFVQWFALVLWLTRRHPCIDDDRQHDLLGPYLICGVMLYLQIFPRTDLTHWMTSAPLLFPCMVWLLQSLTVRWSVRRDVKVRRAVGAAIVLPIVALCLLRIGNSLDARWDWVHGGIVRTPETVLRIAHAPIAMNVGRAETARNLEAVVDFIANNSVPDDPVFTFPALDYISYLSLRRPGNRHGYYFPGWPGHETEAEVLASLENRPPRLAVTVYESQLYFNSAAAFYFMFADFFESRYHRVARRGPYAIFAPNGSVGAVASEVNAGGGASPSGTPDAIAEALGKDRMERVRDAVSSPDPKLRLALAREFAEWRINGDFEPLRIALADPDPRVRAAAVRAVPRTQSSIVRDVLLHGVTERMLTTADSVLAIRSAGAACDSSCVPTLLALTVGHEWDVSAAARGLLGELPTSRWLRDFWWLWEGDGNAPFPKETVSRLLPALENPNSDRDMRRLAFAFADRLGLTPCARTLRRWARKRLERIGPDFDACLALHHLARANCPGPWLALALGWLPVDPTLSARTVLSEARKDPVRADRNLARNANAHSGKANAVTQWVCGMVGGEHCMQAARATLTASRSEEERVAAAWSWAQLARSDAEIEELLVKVATDASPQVRETARYGIARRELQKRTH